MPRPCRRLLAVSHDYSYSGAPIALYRALPGAGDWEVLVASPFDGPLRAGYRRAGIRADVAPGLRGGGDVAAELLRSADVLLANRLLSCAAVRAAHRLGKPALLYVHEAQMGAAWARAVPEMADALALADCVIYPARFLVELYARYRRGGPTSWWSPRGTRWRRG